MSTIYSLVLFVGAAFVVVSVAVRVAGRLTFARQPEALRRVPSWVGASSAADESKVA